MERSGSENKELKISSKNMKRAWKMWINDNYYEGQHKMCQAAKQTRLLKCSLKIYKITSADAADRGGIWQVGIEWKTSNCQRPGFHHIKPIFLDLNLKRLGKVEESLASIPTH